MNRSTIETAATVTVALCAVIVCAVIVGERVRGRGLQASAESTTTLVADWESYAKGANRAGPDDARVTITVFSDFQCPFCASLQPLLNQMRERYPDDVALVYRHFPLQQIHPFALEAALASQCAGAVSRFWQFHDAMFQQQAQIGAKAWTLFALEAGVVDTLDFRRCISRPATAAVVNADIAAGNQLGVRGTPTILVNDQRVTGPLTSAGLDAIVERALRGGSHE